MTTRPAPPKTAAQRAEQSRRRRRADAERNVAVILDAAIQVLNQRPGASMDDIASSAGVSRQTVYTHFPSRDALLDAVVARAVEEARAALDAAQLEEGPPTAALVRLLNAGWLVSGRYPFLFQLEAVGLREDIERHRPIVDRLERLIRRGQASGDFDPRQAPAWLLAATFALANAAGEELRAGRMTTETATSALHHSILRLFGISDAHRPTMP